MRPHFQKGEQTLDTYLSMGDEDFNSVIIHYEIERPEPDVGFTGGLIINSVLLGDKDLMVEMTEKEVAELEDRITEEHFSYNDEY